MFVIQNVNTGMYTAYLNGDVLDQIEVPDIQSAHKFRDKRIPDRIKCPDCEIVVKVNPDVFCF